MHKTIQLYLLFHFNRCIIKVQPHRRIAMYTNAAYLHDSFSDFMDLSKPLIVTCCGYYRIQTMPVFLTERPLGRKDYQLLYIASGKAHFFIHGNEQIVTEGNMVLYRPGDPQKYFYYAADKTEVYWIHFTGSEVDKLLTYYDIPDTENVFYTGTTPDYQQLYRQIIQELQLCRPNYEELLSLFLRQIFLTVNRYRKEGRKTGSDILDEIERATHYFNENYHSFISIEDYAKSRHLSTCWFIRNFRQIVKLTPMQYILSLRMMNAQNLLENTDYNITEIAEAVGYDNPLYSSRLFHKHTGMAPSAYRNLCRERLSERQ